MIRNLVRNVLRALILTPFILPIHAEVLIDAVQTGSQGYECYQVLDGNELVLSRHNQERKAIAACTTAKTLNIDGEYRVRATGYIRIVVSSDAQAKLVFGQGVIIGPEEDPVPAPPTGGSGIAIGGTVTCTANESAGVYTLTADGGGEPDNGCLFELGTITSSSLDRQISFRVSSVTGSTHNFAQAGVQSRAGIVGADVMTQIGFPLAGGCRAKYRDVLNDPWTGGILGDTGATLPHYCAMVYNAGFPRVEWYYSATGGTNPANWSLISTHAVSQGTGKDYIYCVNGGVAESTATCVVDNVSFEKFLIDTQPSEPPPSPTNSTYGSGFDLTDNTSANEGWPTSFPAIREGMSWAMPPTTAALVNTGIFLNQNDVPTYYEGKLLKKCNWDWRDFEPTNDGWDWTLIENDLLDPDFDGCMVNVRGVVASATDCNDNPAFSTQVTAPAWIVTGSNTQTEDCHGSGFKATNLLISHSTVKAEREEFIRHLLSTSRPALGNQTVCEHPNFVAAIIHGVSESQGEEWNGPQTNSAGTAAQQDYISEIVTACASDTKKFAWLNEGSLWNYSVIQNGTGWRGGSGENFFRLDYSGGTSYGNSNPSTSEMNCMEYTNGYIEFSDPCFQIDEARHSQDQIEAYRGSNNGGPANWPRNYRMAFIRQMQMRRNVIWADNNLALNPRLSNWGAVSQLGKSQGGPSPGASGWVLLGRGYAYFAGGPKPIYNLERNLLQRESYGATTYLDQTDCCRIDLNEKPAQNGAPYGEEYWIWDAARLPPSTGLNINYDNGAGGGTINVAIEESGAIRTYYARITDFRASATPGNDDFDISGMGIEVERRFINDTVSSGAQDIVMKVSYYDKTFSGKVPIMFIETIKCGGSFPAC